jgi:hypothetical protein
MRRHAKVIVSIVKMSDVRGDRGDRGDRCQITGVKFHMITPRHAKAYFVFICFSPMLVSSLGGRMEEEEGSYIFI